MTEAEALAVLQIESRDEAADAFEWEVFEMRKFLQEQPVFLATHRNRISKFSRIEAAFLSLGFPAHRNFEIPLLSVEFGDLLIREFLHWQRTKNELRFLVNQCNTTVDFSGLSHELITTELNFVQLFSNWPDEVEVKVSQKPDVMELLREMRMLDPDESRPVSWFAGQAGDLPEMLRLELKRLSLLKKYLTDE